MARFFNADGSEYKSPPTDQFEHIGEVGGKPEKVGAIIHVYSEKLDKERVTRFLETNPTKAWNPNERHSFGNAHNGLTRELEYGKWYLSTETNEESIDEKIEKLFAACTQNFENWRLLSEEYETWLTIVGHINNWNREMLLNRKTLKLIAERNLSLLFDIYFDTDEDDEQ